MEKKENPKSRIEKKDKTSKKKVAKLKKEKQLNKSNAKLAFKDMVPILAKKLLIPISLLMLTLIIILSVIIFKYAYNPLIADGIFVENVLIPNYSHDELIVYLEKHWPKPAVNNTIKIYYDKWENSVTFKDLEVTIDYQKLANQIELVGNNGWFGKRLIERLNVKRNGKILTLPITFNATSVNSLLKSAYDAIHTQTSSSVLKISDSQVSIQSGTDGIDVNIQTLSLRITSQLNQLSSANIIIPIEVIRPPKIDSNDIFMAIDKKADISFVKNDSGENVISSKIIGRSIDIEVLINEITLLENRTDRKVTTRILPVTFTDPEPSNVSISNNNNETTGDTSLDIQLGVTSNNVIAHFETYFSTNTKDDISRANNIMIASKAINGTIIQPHKQISFNSITGSRSISSGYLSAPVYQNGSIEMGIGGGVCQVSSTIFNAILLAGLTTTERHEHMFPVNYVAPGRDAAVSYGYQDLCIQNPYEKPVTIKVIVYDKKLMVQIMMDSPPSIPVMKIYTRVFSHKPDSSLDSTKYIQLSDNTSPISEELNGSYVETWIQEYIGEDLLSEKKIFSSHYQPYPVKS